MRIIGGGVRRDERQIRLRTGIVVAVFAALLFAVLFVVGQAQDVFIPKTWIYGDFVVTSGLRKGSPVQLAGVQIGQVSAVDYVDVRYECEPSTEDIGRYGAGRTDNCDKRLFCTEAAQCGDLEPMARGYAYTHCVDDRDCETDEVCVTTEFRRRQPRVLWMGPHGVCARYRTIHHRVRVQMTLESEHLELIRRDSRASISANSVLGDQLVNITAGIGDAVAEHERILSEPSLAEDIALYRMRLERAVEQVDEALAAVSGLVAELGDRRTLDAIKGLATNLEEISLAIAQRRGLIGALVGDPIYKRDFGMILHALGATAGGVDHFVGRGNRILATADRNLGPLVAEVRATTESLRELIRDLKDPANLSVVALLIDDPDGSIVADLEAILEQSEEITDAVASLTAAVDGEKGTLGKLVGDLKLADDLGRLLHNLESKEALKWLLLRALERKGIGVQAARSPAGPPRRRRRQR